MRSRKVATKGSRLAMKGLQKVATKGPRLVYDIRCKNLRTARATREWRNLMNAAAKEIGDSGYSSQDDLGEFVELPSQESLPYLNEFIKFLDNINFDDRQDKEKRDLIISIAHILEVKVQQNKARFRDIDDPRELAENLYPGSDIEHQLFRHLCTFVCRAQLKRKVRQFYNDNREELDQAMQSFDSYTVASEWLQAEHPTAEFDYEGGCANEPMDGENIATWKYRVSVKNLRSLLE